MSALAYATAGAAIFVMLRHLHITAPPVRERVL